MVCLKCDKYNSVMVERIQEGMTAPSPETKIRVLETTLAELEVNTTGRWAYPYFKEYLLALTRGPDFLLPFEDYPKRIELGKPWHELLDQMRQESKDGIERWALVGFKDDKRSLYLPTILTKGSSHAVSGKIIEKAVEYAKTKAGIIDLVGDIHSHPNGWLTKLYHLQNPLYAPFKGNLHAFSTQDLFVLRHMSFVGLSEGDRNLFAFKSRETHTVPDYALESNFDEFEKYWNHKMGIRNIKIKNFQAEIPIDPRYNAWSMNKKIANKHKIVLYKGSPDKDLVRVVPKQSTPIPQ